MNEDVRASVFHEIDGCVNEDCNYIKLCTSLYRKNLLYFYTKSSYRYYLHAHARKMECELK